VPSTGLHLFTIQNNGDNTTSIQLDDNTPVVDDAGAETYGFGTSFANVSGTNTLNGSQAERIIIPGALDDSTVSAIRSYLLAGHRI